MYIAKKDGAFSYADQTKVVVLKKGDRVSSDTPPATLVRWLERGNIEKIAESFSVPETKEIEPVEQKAKPKKTKAKKEDEA